MAPNLNFEQLTPLDIVMPRTYVQALLTFRTTDQAAFAQAQRGLSDLSMQLPWLSGRVFPSTMPDGERPSLQLRWTENETPPKLIDYGTIPASYEALSAKGMSPADIPPDVWPTPNLTEDIYTTHGAPAFAASLFRFSDDKGVGLCVSIHHNIVDATGFAEILRCWAGSVTQPGSNCPGSSQGRLARLSDALATELQAVSASSLDDLFASHPAYSRTPPALPAEFPPCTSKLFRIPIAQLDNLKQLLEGRMATAPSTNTLLCSLVWQAVTRARTHRNPALAQQASRLVTAVDGRQRIDQELSAPTNPYLGNVVLYALAEASVQDLGVPFEQDSAGLLASICESIRGSQSPAQVNRQYIAEVYSLVDRIENYKTVYPGWDLFNSCDLTITSWADLPLYGLDFGQALGKPDFVRVPYMEADGVSFILPRKRAADGVSVSDEVLDVVVMLRRDDMQVLEQDSLWKTLTG